MGKRGSYLTVFVICFLLAAAVLFLEYCKPANTGADLTTTAENAYVGDQKCQSCHTKEYTLWQQSDHYKAMMPANDTTVLGDFNDRSMTSDGITSRFFKRDGKYIINTEGPDGQLHDYEVLYTFGHAPLQQYLVAFPGGRMQVPRVSWDVRKNKWFHQYGGQKLDHRDWLHWSSGGQNWNTMCASCHSTNLKKNYFPDADSFHTTYDVINVSCESCHGAGKKHIDFVGSEQYKNGNRIPFAYLTRVDSPNVVQVNSCAPCHARKADINGDAINPNQLLDNIIPEIPTTEFFHADGQVDDEDYIYTSFLQSKMFHRSVKCSNCHDPHSSKLVLPKTLVCLQCHEKKFESFEHTRHNVPVEQVNCVSCHMPGKFYMGNDFRHDHSFRVPRPDLSVKYGTPNACNTCHADKKAQWAADAVVKWFGQQRKYHFSDDLVPGSKLEQGSEVHLLRLMSDTSIPSIIKATAAEYLRNIPTRQSIDALLQALNDRDPQVRYRSVRALSSFPYEQWKDAVSILFSDKVRAVRIAAADVLLQVPIEQIPTDHRNAFSNARKEVEQYVMYQADFAVGNVLIGDFYYRLSDQMNAEKYYKRGLKKDSLMNYVRFNLSSLYNTQGRNAEALKLLEEARNTDASNPRVYYNIALLQVEMKEITGALQNFEKAIEKGADDPRIFYNYGLLQQQQGNVAAAEKLLIKGLAIAPQDAAINYALAVFYMQQQQPRKAMGPASVLKRTDPGNPNYQQLFSKLQIN